MSEPVGTTIRFRLPIGYQSREKTRHRDGTLRMPTQKDLTIVIMQAGGVDNPAYLETLMLSRLLVDLEGVHLEDSNRQEIVESLTLVDVDMLNHVYQLLISGVEPGQITCPHCQARLTFGNSSDQSHATDSDHGVTEP